MSLTQSRFLTVLALGVALAAGSQMSAQSSNASAQSIRKSFQSVNQRLLEMARDFPEAKYSYRPSPEVRSFPEVIEHALEGNVYVAKAGRGEKAEWGEGDGKTLKTRSAVVAALEKSINDANATLKSIPDDRLVQTLTPWLDVLEHSAEHYGQLVAYYRANGLVPPASRPKK